MKGVFTFILFAGLVAATAAAVFWAQEAMAARRRYSELENGRARSRGENANSRAQDAWQQMEEALQLAHEAAEKASSAGATITLSSDKPIDLSKYTFPDAQVEGMVDSHGNEALQLASNWKGTIDILVTDLVMPGLSGQALAEAVKQARPAVRIIYMSGYTPDVIVQHGDLPPGAVFLPKPFWPSSLLAALDDVLALPSGQPVRNTPEESSSSRSK